ncbi:MAG: SHOCT domain-containing protein [Acidimicrobiia bacterium]
MYRALTFLAQATNTGPGGPGRGGPDGGGGPSGGRTSMEASRRMIDAGARHMDHSDMHWVGLVVITLLALVALGVVVWAVIYLTRTRTRALATATSQASGPSARAILDERYARGEIDTPDYEERRAKLE